MKTFSLLLPEALVAGAALVCLLERRLGLPRRSWLLPSLVGGYLAVDLHQFVSVLAAVVEVFEEDVFESDLAAALQRAVGAGAFGTGLAWVTQNYGYDPVGNLLEKAGMLSAYSDPLTSSVL